MLLSAVSVLVIAQSSSEIPEGLMNNHVLRIWLGNQLQCGNSEEKQGDGILGISMF